MVLENTMNESICAISYILSYITVSRAFIQILEHMSYIYVRFLQGILRLKVRYQPGSVVGTKTATQT